MASRYDGITQEAFRSLFTNPYDDIQDGLETPEVAEPRPALTMQESFERGLDSGISGLQSSAAAFKALTKTLVGSDEGVSEAIKE